MQKNKKHIRKNISKLFKNNKFLDYVTKSIGIIVISLIILELLSFLAINTYKLLNKDVNYIEINNDIFKNKNWTSEYFSEFEESYKTEYFPYVGYRRVPNYEGKYININNESIRKTINPCLNNSLKKIKIFVFGGSTIWGIGSRDIGTIPSYLSKYLCPNNYSIEVTNFGEDGYTNTQEIIKFELELRKNNIPDIVIFYDGINDFSTSYQNEVAGFPHNVENRKREFNSKDKLSYNIIGLFSNLYKVLYKIKEIIYIKKSNNIFLNANLNNDIINIYFNNIKIIKSLENDYKFKSFFYWQPLISTKQNLSKDEINIYNKKYFNYLHINYNLISNLINESNEVINLIDIFNNINETIFMDYCHISENGNSIIAKKISKDILEYLNKEYVK